MIKIALIRHGKTFGNTLRRYIGTTDEDLLETSISELQNKLYPQADILYVSPMKRCLQTAKAIYGDKSAIIVEDFRECDFGDFENKSYEELETNKDYQNWMKTNKLFEFPNGENLKSFVCRITTAFDKVVKTHKNDDIRIALIVHGGTIMNIMQHISTRESNLYDWHVKNGCGYEFIVTNNKIEALKEI